MITAAEAGTGVAVDHESRPQAPLSRPARKRARASLSLRPLRTNSERAEHSGVRLNLPPGPMQPREGPPHPPLGNPRHARRGDVKQSVSAAESARKRLAVLFAMDATCERGHLVVYPFKKNVASVRARNWPQFVRKFSWASLEMLVTRIVDGVFDRRQRCT
jgi:hypothetical protein